MNSLVTKEAQHLEPGDILYTANAERIGMVRAVNTIGGDTTISFHDEDEMSNYSSSCHADWKFFVQEWRPSQAV